MSPPPPPPSPAASLVASSGSARAAAARLVHGLHPGSHRSAAPPPAARPPLPMHTCGFGGMPNAPPRCRCPCALALPPSLACMAAACLCPARGCTAAVCCALSSRSAKPCSRLDCRSGAGRRWQAAAGRGRSGRGSQRRAAGRGTVLGPPCCCSDCTRLVHLLGRDTCGCAWRTDRRRRVQQLAMPCRGAQGSGKGRDQGPDRSCLPGRCRHTPEGRRGLVGRHPRASAPPAHHA